jgi:hypothetical protein
MRRSLWAALHSPMMPGKWPKGNLDPSRSSAALDGGSVRGKRVAGRGDRAALRDSADAGGWRAAAARFALARGRTCCNSVARDRSARRERKLRDTGCRSRPVTGARLRPEPPCAFAGGARQGRLFRGNVKPVCVGAPNKGRHTGTLPLPTTGFHSRLPPPSANIPSSRVLMIGSMTRAFGADEVGSPPAPVQKTTFLDD